MMLPYPPVYHCVRTAEPVTVDGRLDEGCWASAPPVLLVNASTGNRATPRTTARLCWGATHLYVGFECEDDDAWGSYGQRDDPLYDEEVVELFLCPSGDVRRYYEIEISPHNVIFDAALHSPQLDRRTMTTDREWACEGMLSAVSSNTIVHRTPPGRRTVTGPPGVWSAELAIPFKALRLTGAPEVGAEWRVNLYRIDRGARSRYLAWSPTLRRPADFHVPERFGTLRFEDDSAVELLRGRWLADRAGAWYGRQPWLVGCNFTPSSASNQLEMWQADTYDPATIDRELGWASELGMNVVRVYLHDIAWQTDPEGFKARVRRFLAIAARHRIRTILVIFDDCWNPEPRPGPQKPPIPGVHNSRWLQSPGRDVVNDASSWRRVEAYVRDVVSAFAGDRRILMWDLYNEPGNSGQGVRSLPLLRRTFEWARACRPTQPLTAGIWHDSPELNRFQIEHSDVITFHNYEDAASLRAQITELSRYGRPVICTEWMARPTSAIATHLPVFRETRTGCVMWGLVSGKTQTVFPWGSSEGSPEPATWFHDLLHRDGSPYDTEEVALLRFLTDRPTR